MPSAPKAVPSSVNSWNAEFLDEQYRSFKNDPTSVPEDVRSFFQGFDLALASSTRVGAGERSEVSRFQAQVDDLIHTYRVLGHTKASLDPFGREPSAHPALALGAHGLSESDLDQTADGTAIGLGHDVPLRQILERLEFIYCGPIAIEVMHIQDYDELHWLLEHIEQGQLRQPPDKGLRVHLLELLLHSEMFEKFLGRRYPGEKRFSLEGGESLIALLDQFCEASTDHGVEEIVFGMAHRGRLNVLNGVIGKSFEQIFTEFEDNWEEDFVDGGGDVKYHRGYSGTRVFRNGKKLHLAMASNPSHLEAVGPVVLGRCRAKQRLRADRERRRVIPLLIHGDAAVAGQGVVAESLNMSQLEGYYTGGCVHVVVNNLIGFTTTPEDARSSRYCTDVAKMIAAPVLHVNGEDPEAVIACARLAIEYRQRFRKDLFIDMYCYRRYGHNEQDEQSFTQPILAGLIKKKESVLHVYADRLVEEGVLTEADKETIATRLDAALERAQESAKVTPHDPTIDPGSVRWEGFSNKFVFEQVDTSAPRALVEEVCAALGSVPDGFKVNTKLKRLLQGRSELPETSEISYADAESIAYGTLLCEGVPVRLTGQDVRRGTFSHRHAVLRDAKSEEMYEPLNNIREVGHHGTDTPPGSVGSGGKPRQAQFCIYDSPLSEASVLGFDYGYSLADPEMLVLWEAQFGDFVNGAQVVIDQFLASAELKWQRWSGLVLLLPHGYEGAGPEHSSARLERFLQLCGDDNLQVIYPSTAAQVFHVLRRQVKRSFRKPLVMMTPKSMLRIPTSTIDQLWDGAFHEMLDDAGFAGDDSKKRGVKRVLYCTGKIYHELHEKRQELERDDVAIVRIEQLYPFHTELFRSIDRSYPSGAERVWVQEEPRNMGAFLYTADAMREEGGLAKIRYIGRATSATPATGSKKVDRQQQRRIIEQAFDGLDASGEKKRVKQEQVA